MLASLAGLAALPWAEARAQEKLIAVTTFTVLQDLAQNVAGEAATVVSISPPGAEIHNYQPSPHDVIRAQKCKARVLERAQSRAMVRALLWRSLGRAAGAVDRKHRADEHFFGRL